MSVKSLSRPVLHNPLLLVFYVPSTGEGGADGVEQWKEVEWGDFQTTELVMGGFIAGGEVGETVGREGRG